MVGSHHQLALHCRYQVWSGRWFYPSHDAITTSGQSRGRWSNVITVIFFQWNGSFAFFPFLAESFMSLPRVAMSHEFHDPWGGKSCRGLAKHE